MEFNVDESFVSVGIGPLCYADEYVEVGEPAPELKGDIWFVAKQMGLRYPPMHIGTKEEIKIFTEFMKNHTPTAANFKKLAKIYRQQSNGITIFPKLPSMIESYFKRWEKNQKIKVAEITVGKHVKELLRRLWKSSTNVTNVYDHNTAMQAIEYSNNDDNSSQDKNGNLLLTMNEEAIVPDQTAPTVQIHRYVPPLQAPQQQAYICSARNMSQEQLSRNCAWYPLCKAFQNIKRLWANIKENIKKRTAP